MENNINEYPCIHHPAFTVLVFYTLLLVSFKKVIATVKSKEPSLIPCLSLYVQR